VLTKLLDRPAAPGLAWLTVGLAGTTRLVAVEEVLYVQSCEKYTEAVTARERYLIRTPLRELEGSSIRSASRASTARRSSISRPWSASTATCSAASRCI